MQLDSAYSNQRKLVIFIGSYPRYFMRVIISATLALLLCAVLTISVHGTDTGSLNISTQQQIEVEFKSVPCKDSERLKAVRVMFENMGVAPSDISIEKYKNVENLVVRKQGSTEEKIVIGAHYDKVNEGCGAVDNWTGIVALAHLYRTFKDYPTNKTMLFVAFGKEEKGLIGSQAMVKDIKKEEIGLYCSMINIDSLGLAIPQAANNMSSDSLVKLAKELAEQMKMPFGSGSVAGGMSDSNSFLGKKIPAVTIHGLADNWKSVLHSGNDQPQKINSTSVYLGYRLALAMIKNVDEAECSSYR
jgi:Iap family predicted aminopeptidase